MHRRELLESIDQARHPALHQGAGQGQGGQGPRAGRGQAAGAVVRGSEAGSAGAGGRTHLGNGVRQQAAELLVSAVPHPAPPGGIKVLPDPPQADGHPLAQQGVGVAELLQADGNQVPLEAGFLERAEGTRWTVDSGLPAARAWRAVRAGLLTMLLVLSPTNFHSSCDWLAQHRSDPLLPWRLPALACSGRPLSRATVSLGVQSSSPLTPHTVAWATPLQGHRVALALTWPVL